MTPELDLEQEFENTAYQRPGDCTFPEPEELTTPLDQEAMQLTDIDTIKQSQAEDEEKLRMEVSSYYSPLIEAESDNKKKQELIAQRDSLLKAI